MEYCMTSVSLKERKKQKSLLRCFNVVALFAEGYM